MLTMELSIQPNSNSVAVRACTNDPAWKNVAVVSSNVIRDADGSISINMRIDETELPPIDNTP